MIALYMSLIEEEEQQNKFEQLYFKYRSLMFYIADEVLHQAKDSEDAVQEAFIRIAKNMDKIGDVECSATKNFIGIITKREAMKIYDKKKKRREIMESQLSQDSQGNETNFFDHIADKNSSEVNQVALAIEELPYKYSSLMTLKYVLGYSGEEISQIVGLTQNNVRQQLYKGRKLLEKILNN